MAKKTRKRWEYRKPLEATGGIKLRTTLSKKSELNWWSRRFLDIIESDIDAKRLARAKTYARRGQVLSLEITPGMVAAAVQGSRERPYLVRMAFSAIDPDDKSLLLLRLRERAGYAASLLAGELTEEIADVFAYSGIKLLPDKNSMKFFRCSCPDDGEGICKHIVAVLLIMTELFDDDPFLILKLRGIDRDKLTELLTVETPDPNEADYGDYTQERDMSGGEEHTGFDGLPSVTGGSDPEDTAEALKSEREKRSLEDWFTSKAPELSYNAGGEDLAPAALEFMNEFPLWRGERPFKQSLEIYYDSGAKLAYEILTGEKLAKVGRPKKYF